MLFDKDNKKNLWQWSGPEEKERWNNKRDVGGGVVRRIKKEKDRNQKKKKKQSGMNDLAVTSLKNGVPKFDFFTTLLL